MGCLRPLEAIRHGSWETGQQDVPVGLPLHCRWASLHSSYKALSRWLDYKDVAVSHRLVQDHVHLVALP